MAVTCNNVGGKRVTTSSNHAKKKNNKSKKMCVVNDATDLPPLNQEKVSIGYRNPNKRDRKWLARVDYAKQKIQEFADRLKFAEGLPANEKPSRESWKLDINDRKKFRALEKYALKELHCDNDREIEQEVMAGRILRAMGYVGFTCSTAAKVLINIGYFSLHVNLDLLRLKFYPYNEDDEEISTKVDGLLKLDDKEKDTYRQDLTGMDVYAIDPEGAEELDDALSVTRLPDGRIKVWIHIADPSNLVKPNSIMDLHARDRGTTVYLPTGTYPMFPKKLAMEGMSLRHGKCCNAISVSVVLDSDGSIGDYSVDISTIKPTMLTYMDATDLLNMDSIGKETVDLRLLLEAANVRMDWRMKHGADNREDIHDARLKVTNLDNPEPTITIYKEDEENTGSAHRLVKEMMLLCSEVTACFGSRNNIPLPYRVPGRFSFWPEPHNCLGLIHGYVQVTSPIRRYMDLVAHHQLKAFLTGKELLTAFDLQRMGGYANNRMVDARILERNSTRYWMTEYLRRSQAKGEKFGAKVVKFCHYSESAAQILLKDLGFRHVVDLPEGVKEGAEITVVVENADPRDKLLDLKLGTNYVQVAD